MDDIGGVTLRTSVHLSTATGPARLANDSGTFTRRGAVPQSDDKIKDMLTDRSCRRQARHVGSIQVVHGQLTGNNMTA